MRVRRIALLSAAIIVVGSALSLAFRGSVILVDVQREVKAAEIVDGWGQRQELTSLGIAYAGVPRLEGTVEIRCRNGKVIRRGYVTPGVPTWQQMAEDGECSTR